MADDTNANVKGKKWKLIFLAIHGLGPQSLLMREKFLGCVKKQVVKDMPKRVTDNYVALTPDWSHDFRNASDSWLYSQIHDNLDWGEFIAKIEDVETKDLLDKVKQDAGRLDFPTLREYYIGAKGGPDFARLGPDVKPEDLENAPRGKVNAAMGKVNLSESLGTVIKAIPSFTKAVTQWVWRVAKPILLIILLIILGAALVHGLFCKNNAGIFYNAGISVLITLSVIILVGILFMVLFRGKVLHSLWKRCSSETAVKDATAKLQHVGENFPWSSVYGIARPFEAHSISDIMLYSSTDPRLEILDTIISSLKEQIKDVDPDTDIFLVLGGHSLGSVIAYDLMRASIVLNNPNRLDEWKANMLAKVKDYQKSDRSKLAKTRINADEFVENTANFIKRIKPVGLITFGSPVSLFMFRKPSLFHRLNIWKEVCPDRYIADKAFTRIDPHSGLEWRWLNFWHPSDFVAHRLDPFFNTSELTADKLFVEDIETNKACAEPVAAHSSYWEDPEVHRMIAEYIRTNLFNLDQYGN